MKRLMTIALLTAVLLVSVCAPALAEYKVYATDEYHYEKQFYTKLKRGDSGSKVRNLQWRLVELGYLNSGDVDGIYGQVTQNAVYCFQINNWLTGSDGQGYVYTQYKLFSDFAVPSWGFSTSESSLYDYGFEVERLERRLCDTGYMYDCDVDGFFDSTTESAVMKFQSLNNIYPIDGVADMEVLRKLYSYNMTSYPKD